MTVVDQNLHLNLNVRFPIQDGRVLVQGPLTYDRDGLATRHNADFMKDPFFMEAYRLGADTCRSIPEWADLHIEWRIHVSCWAASCAVNLPGDFVECGVNTGIHSRSIIHYIDFNSTGKVFYLADTFCGIPAEQVSEPEKRVGLLDHNRRYYFEDRYEAVKETFQGFNVKIIRGKIPDSLPLIDADKVCFLHIDMNIAKPEIDAAEYFWEKLVPGAFVLLDDYGYGVLHNEQKRAFDDFAQRKNVRILSLPTGQGLMIRP